MVLSTFVRASTDSRLIGAPETTKNLFNVSTVGKF
jgi:hypothetical protein